MNDKRNQELKEKITDLKKCRPAHSVLPAMLQELDDLGEELAKESGKDRIKKDDT
jgi:hypothetical protein